MERDLEKVLRASLRWQPDGAPDLAAWWREPGLIPRLGPALAALHEGAGPTVVLSPQPRGVIPGALAAAALGAPLVELHHDVEAPEQWRAAPSGHGRLCLRRDLVTPDDVVLLVDDWIGTGSAARAAHELVSAAGATWAGAAVVGDALDDDELRARLAVRGLVRPRRQ